MSFKTQLLVQSEVFDVRDFTLSFGQPTDALGRPDSRVQGGTVEVELDAQPNELLHAWAQDDTERLDCVIQVMEADSATVRDTIKLFDAYCVGLTKQFQDANSVQGMGMQLMLSANRLQHADVELHNQWPDLPA